MLGTFGKLSVYNFDYDGFTKSLDKEMSIILRGAVKVWVRTLLHAINNAPHTVGDTFPIQTGQAKAAIRPIARYVRVPLPIRPNKGRPDLTSQGESLSSFNISDDKTNPGSYEYTFDWETHVVHWLINEFHQVRRVTSDTPWHATSAAKKAADAYIKKEVRARLRKYTVKSYIKVK